jgi:hypothetical protein
MFIKFDSISSFGAQLVGFVNMITVFVAVLLLSCKLFIVLFLSFIDFGRKTLMTWMSLAIGADLIALCFVYNAEIDIGVIILILLFVSLFEFSMGPIVWIYLSETMCEKGVAFALFINLVLTIL